MKNKKEKLFGTDGIRGVPGKYPLTDGMVFKIGKSLCQYLYYKGKGNGGNRKLKVIIGKDTRISGSRIEALLINAFASSGIDVLLAGIIPTPGLSFMVDKFRADLGVMVSASHNKPLDNGIKLFTSGGRKISVSDEEWIEDIVFSSLIRRSSNLDSNQEGEVKNIVREVTHYPEFLRSTLEGADISGLSVCFDSNWGATSLFVKEVFKGLGVNFYSINDYSYGEAINSSGFTNYSQLKSKVLETSSDAGFAFDGDGDRAIVVDEGGNLLDGDDILAIIAKHYLDKGKLFRNSIVATQMSNFGFKNSLENMGIKVILASVGDRNVLEAVINNKLNLGGEHTGHIIFLDYLPTPDGMLTALELLKIIKETGLPLSRLTKAIKRIPQAIINIPVKERVDFKNISSVSKEVNHFNLQLKDKGRIFLRYSRTENVARLKVEAKTEEKAKDIANAIASTISKEIGAKSGF